MSFELLLFPSASDLWFVFENLISVISVISLNPLFKKNLCKSVVSVGDYSCYSSYSCSRNKSVYICGICGRIIFLCISVVSVGE